jgi:ABC-type transport system involved in multi-copper enzyme maturation permease subunit
MSLVPAELETGTVSMLITKPLGRCRFMLTKFVAAELIVALNLLVLALVTFATVLWWGVEFDLTLLRNLGALFLALSTLTAAIMAFSVITTAPSAAILGLLFYGLAKWPGIVTQIAAHSPAPLSWLLAAVHALLPDLGKLNFEAPLLQVPPQEMLQGALSALLSIAIWLALGIWAFNRKQL